MMTSEIVSNRSTFSLAKQIEPCVILPIAAGFNEESVVLCVSRLRRRAVRVWLVSPDGRSVRSQHGLTLKPDKHIRELGPTFHAAKILLTGGDYSLQTILNSADMLLFFAETARTGGEILATEDSAKIVEESGLMTSFGHLRWRIQSGESLSDFLNQVGPS